MMRLYQRHCRCPKCGESWGIFTRYIPGERDPEAGYLERRCGHCRYTWHEKPLDQQESGWAGEER